VLGDLNCKGRAENPAPHNSIGFHRPFTNSGFEAGSAMDWSVLGPVVIATGANVATGNYAVQVGSTSPTNVDGKLKRQFTVPSDARALKFSYRLICKDTVAYDWMTVSLRDEVTQTDHVLMPKSCSNTGAWTTVELPIPSAARGHSATLTVLVHDDNYPGDETWAYVDDFRLLTGLALVEPVSATYSQSDDSYYVLDKALGAAGSAVLRLLRISAARSIEEIAEWPRTNWATAYAVKASPQGGVTLTAWSSSAWKVAELTPSHAGAEVLAFFAGTGSLSGPALKPPGESLMIATNANGVFATPTRLKSLAFGNVTNGSFEGGTLAEWSPTGSVSAATEAAFSGSFAARVGAEAVTSTSSLVKTFTVPSGAITDARQTLSFVYLGACSSGSSGRSFSVTVTDQTNGQSATIVPATCVQGSSWVSVRASLAQFAGHTVDVAFTNTHNGSSDENYTYVDDVRLELSPSLLASAF